MIRRLPSSTLFPYTTLFRSRQTRLCLDCHKDIAADVAAKRGYHGHLTGITTSECRGCHSEHLGRGADIIKLSRSQFDHEGTDFPLRDAHADVACASCHIAGKPYRKAATECVDCHRK